MLLIAVIDDDFGFKAKLENMLNTIKGKDDVVHTYSDGDSFLSAFRTKPYDLIFLDACMPGIDGLDVAKELREISQSTLIVVVTEHLNYAPDFFQFNVFRFILKPPEKSALRQALADARSESEKIRNETLLIKSKGITRKIYYKEILFFESSHNRIVIHTVGEIYTTNTPLREFERMLSAIKT